MEGMDKLRPPFRVVEGEEAFWIEDADGYRFGYCYHDGGKPTVGTGRMERLPKDVARRMAGLIARLPDLVGK